MHRSGPAPLLGHRGIDARVTGEEFCGNTGQNAYRCDRDQSTNQHVLQHRDALFLSDKTVETREKFSQDTGTP